MKVKAIRKFNDKKEGVLREVGDTFIVNKNRFQEINSTQYGKLVEEVEEDK